MVNPSTLPLPPAFVERMASLLGDEFTSFLQSYTQPPVVGLRVNTLKISLEDFLRLCPFRLVPVPWCPAGFRVGDESQPGKHPYHAAGLYYLQDPSAMAAAEALAPSPGEKVLDLAAAPGGKSTHLAALMRDAGLLVANEIHPRRVWELAGNLERWGARNAIITQEAPQRLAEHFGAYFDRILLDAPCSGEGMFRRSENARREWAPTLLNSCALRQESLLATAARLLRPGGSLLYATCTFAPEENEAVVDRFLSNHPDFEIATLEWKPGYAPGRPDWATAITGNPPKEALTRAVRLWPHRLGGEGHFLALLRKTGDEPVSKRLRAAARASPQEAKRLVREFFAQNLFTTVEEDRLHLAGANVFLLPTETPDLRGVHVIRPGLWLGSIKKSRFIPAHPLALALQAGDARRNLDFAPEAPELLRYLRGEALPCPFQEQGWVLVSVSGYPLGWGRSSQGILKNFYPHGLRWYATEL